MLMKRINARISPGNMALKSTMLVVIMVLMGARKKNVAPSICNYNIALVTQTLAFLFNY